MVVFWFQILPDHVNSRYIYRERLRIPLYPTIFHYIPIFWLLISSPHPHFTRFFHISIRLFLIFSRFLHMFTRFFHGVPHLHQRLKCGSLEVWQRWRRPADVRGADGGSERLEGLAARWGPDEKLVLISSDRGIPRDLNNWFFADLLSDLES